jgi:hypothetical protein
VPDYRSTACGVPKIASYLQIDDFSVRAPSFDTPQAGHERCGQAGDSNAAGLAIEPVKGIRLFESKCTRLAIRCGE